MNVIKITKNYKSSKLILMIKSKSNKRQGVQSLLITFIYKFESFNVRIEVTFPFCTTRFIIQKQCKNLDLELTVNEV